MRLERYRSALTRAGFLGALAALTVISAGFPTWAQTLRAEGYYADLSLELTRNGSDVTAGSTKSLHAAVRNDGPDDASQPWLLLVPDEGVAIEGNGCSAASGSGVRCTLPALAAGGTDSLKTTLRIDQDARGVLVVGGVLASELEDPNPGNEVDAVWLDVRGSHRVAVSVANPVPQRMQGDRLQWTFIVDNAGPSSVLELHHDVTTYPPDDEEVVLACRAFGEARCATDGRPAYLPADGQLEIDVEVAPLGPQRTRIEVWVDAYATEGDDSGGGHAPAVAEYTTSIFDSGFDTQ